MSCEGQQRALEQGSCECMGFVSGLIPQQQRPHNFTVQGASAARLPMSISPGAAFPSQCPGRQGADKFAGACCELQEPLSFGISETVKAPDQLRLLQGKPARSTGGTDPNTHCTCRIPLCLQQAHVCTFRHVSTCMRMVFALHQGCRVPCCPHPPAKPRRH